MPEVNPASSGTVQFKVQVADLTGKATAAELDLIARNAQAAADYLVKWLAGAGRIDIKLTIDPGVSFAVGRPASFDLDNARLDGTIQLVEPIAVHELRTGADASAMDIEIGISPDLSQFWFDPTPQTSNDIPVDGWDFFTVCLHETLHGLYMNGGRDDSTAVLTSGEELPFDTFVTMVAGMPYFNGPNAKAVYGGPVPLTPGNLYHYGPESAPGTPLLTGVMNAGLPNGVRFLLSDLDVAIMRDCGLPVTRLGDAYARKSGGSGSDVLAAATASQLLGLAGDDSLTGSDAADMLCGGAGNDTLNGSAGPDLALYLGARSAYTVTRTSNGAEVSSQTDGVDTLVNVERLRFSDAMVALDIDGNAGQAYRLYQAAFDRVPDVPGLGYQMNALDIGLSLTQVAGNFIASPEFQTRYGALSDVEFVTQLYRNVLHREPEAAGLSFHVNNLANGLSRAATLVGFSESPENKANVLPAIANGMVYSVTDSALETLIVSLVGVNLSA